MPFAEPRHVVERVAGGVGGRAGVPVRAQYREPTYRHLGRHAGCRARLTEHRWHRRVPGRLRAPSGSSRPLGRLQVELGRVRHDRQRGRVGGRLGQSSHHRVHELDDGAGLLV